MERCEGSGRSSQGEVREFSGGVSGEVCGTQGWLADHGGAWWGLQCMRDQHTMYPVVPMGGASCLPPRAHGGHLMSTPSCPWGAPHVYPLVPMGGTSLISASTLPARGLTPTWQHAFGRGLGF